MRLKKFDTATNLNLAFLQNLGLFVSIFFMLLRIVNLEADFPFEINTSGDLYTDEGWYSNNAVFFERTGEWYIPGAFNPAVNFPVFTIFQIVMFHVFGVSFVTARLLTVAFSIGLIILLFFLVQKIFSRSAAVISILLVTTNFYYFSFSRLALLEIPMTFFAMLSVYVLLKLDERWQLKLLASALCVSTAILIKTSAIFVIPVILYLLWVKKNNYKTKLIQCIAFLSTISILLMGVYSVFIAQAYLQDYTYFSTLSIGSKLNTNLIQNLKDVIVSFKPLMGLDKSFVILLLVFLNFVLSWYKPLRRQFMEKTAPFYIWFGACIMLIAFNHYFPPRYYVMLLIPSIILASVVLDFLLTHNERNYRNAAFVLLALYLSININSILYYTNHQEYTLYNATQDLQSVLAKNNDKGVLFTDSPTVNLGLQNPVIEIRLGLEDVKAKLDRYKPTLFLGFPSTIPEMEKFCDLMLIKEYTVLNNYYTNEPLGLYRITY